MQVIQRPLVTEKLTTLGEKLSRYGFLVHPKANKLSVKREVERMYSVHVLSVHTMRYKGESKSLHTRRGVVKGRLSDTKKAIVTLKAGESINFYA